MNRDFMHNVENLVSSVITNKVVEKERKENLQQNSEISQETHFDNAVQKENNAPKAVDGEVPSKTEVNNQSEVEIPTKVEGEIEHSSKEESQKGNNSKKNTRTTKSKDLSNKKIVYFTKKTVEEYGTYRGVLTKSGDIKKEELISKVILSNLHDLMESDGIDSAYNVAFDASILRNGVPRSVKIELNTNDFNNNKVFNNAIVDKLGVFASTGSNKVNDLRAALLSTSSKEKIEDETTHTATGWNKEHNVFYFLDSVVNGTGYHKTRRLKLPYNMEYLGNFSLADAHISDVDYTKAIEALKNDFLRIYPLETTLPYFVALMSSLYLDFMPEIKPFHTLLLGTTGFQKTSSTKAFMSLFGCKKNMDLMSWYSTTKSIANIGYYAKDLPFIVDDLKSNYVPKTKFIEAIHAYADRQGRSRLNFASGYQEAKYIRGNFISTGEDILDSNEASTTARGLVIELSSKANLEHLTNAQSFASQGIMPNITVRVIQHLIEQSFGANELRFIRTLQQKFNATHERTNEMCAILTFVWNDLITVLPELEEYQEHFKNAIMAIASDMSDRTEAQNSGQIFLDITRELLLENEVRVIDKSASGQRAKECSNKVVGWIDDEDLVYFLSSKLATVVRKRMKGICGDHVPEMNSIYRQLRQDNLIITGKHGGCTFKHRVPWGDKGTANVICIEKKILFDAA